MDLLSTIGSVNQIATFAENVSKFSKCKFALECKIYNSDFIILDLDKHVTIYGDGHGIITCSYNIYVVNPQNFREFYRKVNIEDGSIDAKFPSLSDMMKCDKKDRFTQYGFWYDSTNGIINDVEEYYWQDGDYSSVDFISMNNQKELRWKFKIDTSKLERGKTYNITYSLSIKGMFPVENYKYNTIKSPACLESMSTSLELSSYVRNIKYVVSFEKNNNQFEFSEIPIGELIVDTGNNKPKKTTIHAIDKSNNFYQKFVYITQHRKFSNNTRIRITWKMK